MDNLGMTTFNHLWTGVSNLKLSMKLNKKSTKKNKKKNQRKTIMKKIKRQRQILKTQGYM